MNKTPFLFLFLVLFIGGCDLESETPANIVLILVDDLGWADLGCYGNAFNETSRIDQLAEEGMRFTDAYVASPVCSPSRASIMTGRYPTRIGMTDFIPGHWRPYEKVLVPRNKTQYLPGEELTYAELVKQVGYVTGYFGKWHLGWGKDKSPAGQGFDDAWVQGGWGHFFPPVHTVPKKEVTEGTYLTDYIADEGIRFIEENKDTSFLLCLSHFAVHIPLEAKEEMIQKYNDKQGKNTGHSYPENAIYAAMLESVDQSVGRIVDKLDELGLSGNTLLIFFSDNGGLVERYDRANGVVVTSNEPLRNEKGSLYEGGVRVPLIARWPGTIPTNKEAKTPVSGVDLLPTFLAIAGVTPDSNLLLDGKNILPVLKGNPLGERRSLFFHYPHYHHSFPASSIRRENYKLIQNLQDTSYALYDLDKDLGETNNLVTSQPEVFKNLKAELKDWQERTGAQFPITNPAFDELKREEWGPYKNEWEQF